MTKEERAREIAILVAVGKLYSEQSAMLIGELKHKQNYHFNSSVREIDLFVKHMEGQFGPDITEMIQGIVDEFHFAFNEIRKPA